MGCLSGLIGVDRTGPIDALVLVSRVYESWHHTEAVTHGLASTGRTITAAATIMVLVIGERRWSPPKGLDLLPPQPERRGRRPRAGDAAGLGVGRWT